MVERLTLEPFSEKNIEALHAFFEAHAGLYSFPLDTFKRVTIHDDDFNPEYSIVALDEESKEIVAAFFAVARSARISIRGKMVTLATPVLMLLAVRGDKRRQGIGSSMLAELLRRLKAGKWPASGRNKGLTIRLKKLYVMAAPPNYIWPGLDPRYTPAYFFLKKNGFKHAGERQNLVYDIPATMERPRDSYGDITIRRATMDDRDATVEYTRKNDNGFWAEEIALGFRHDPPTVFVAKDPAGKIVGFAGFSLQFPGSFGPTSVLRTLRGKGVGGGLLKWCAYEIKQQGLPTMTIMWVEGDTMKFYSKSIGAKVQQIYWIMHRKL
ncbi:MAG: GNAT family N-acetyltransferase [Candidatus Lokiarchaeota archaeon]|nr:GNAT family N-acetyltransferase [Candidatus Lokiarchaeota archaeon]